MKSQYEPTCEDCGQPIYPWSWKISDLEKHLLIIVCIIVGSGVLALFIGHTF